MIQWVMAKLLQRATILSARQRELAIDAMSVDDLIRKGFDLQSKGALTGAATLYRKVLDRDPNHVDALFLLADICRHQGDPDQGVPLAEKAISFNPNVAAFHAALGSLYRGQDRFADAEASLRRADAMQPNNAEVLSELGTVLLQQHRLEEAHEYFKLALTLSPELTQAIYNIGITYRQQNALELALPFFEKAAMLQPDSSVGQLELAEVYLALNRPEEAKESYRKAFLGNVRVLEPADRVAKAYFQFGDLLQNEEKYDLAIAQYREAISLGPTQYAFAAWANLGNAHKAQNQLDDALRCYLEAIKLNPLCAQAFCNLGVVLLDMGSCEKALAYYQSIVEKVSGDWPECGPDTPFCEVHISSYLIERALSIDQEPQNFHFNKGVVLEELGHFHAALESYSKAASLAPNDALTNFSWGLSLLRNGEFAAGWKAAEYRLNLPSINLSQNHLSNAPLWEGQSLFSQTLLIHAEQGLGDTIQFIRYYYEVAHRCGQVILEVQKGVKALIADMPGITNVYAAGDALPEYDYQIPLMSLPYILGTRLDNVPAPIPYISAPSDKTEQWRKILAPYVGLKVGLVWGGSPHHKGNRFRSIPLAAFAPLAECRNVTFFSLQKGPPETEMANHPLGDRLVNTSPQQANFLDTAALIANLDLVITIDTSVLHLAGAMGKPTWVLLAYSADWRWLMDREDTPWYPSIKLFRQKSLGDWDECMARVKGELTALAPSTSISKTAHPAD